MRLLYNKNLKQISRDLRNNMTKEEIILWSKLRKNQFNVKFVRQKIVGNYVVDFYCHKASLIIELDGSQHYSEEGLQKDKIRDEYFKNKGLKVLRFSNIEILKNLDDVLRIIWAEIGNEL
ncbi:MAG: DUF559 domain-containing protein [bacterium]